MPRLPGGAGRRQGLNAAEVVAAVTPAATGDGRHSGEAPMVQIDGAQGEGGGQVLRSALALSL
ncbi:MAG: hypothetical protein WAV08_12155, partial [Desulfobacterales bacterium]